MELYTERLILRPWREDDAEACYKYASDPAIGPISGWAVHTSVEYSRGVIRDILSEEETYAVVLKETGEIVGSVGLVFKPDRHSAGPDEKEGEIGYWIGVPFWGRGLIPEAVRELMRRGFEDLGYDVLRCGYYDGNARSRRVQDKCGFRYHHTEENAVSPMGDRRAEHFTCIRRDEWTKAEDTVDRHERAEGS